MRTAMMLNLEVSVTEEWMCVILADDRWDSRFDLLTLTLT
jgi:hypothetical protein